MAKSILLPAYDGAGIVETMIQRGIAFVYGSGSRHDFFALELPTNGAIWFLLALAWAECIFAVIMRSTSNMKSAWRIALLYLVSVLLWFVGYFTAKVTWLPLSIQSAFSAMLFMAIGFHARIQGVFNKYRTNVVAFIVSVLIWIGVIYYSISNENDHMSLVRSAFPSPMINIIGALAGTWSIISIATRIDSAKGGIKQCLSLIGRYSIVVMSMHAIESALPWGGIQRFVPGVPGNLLIFLLKVCCSMVGIWLALHISWIGRIYSIQK